MEMIWSYLKKYKIAVAAALLLTLLELGVELVQPLLIARIIDDGILQEDLGTVLFWGGWLLVFSLAAFAAGIINSFYAAHASMSTGHDLRSAVFRKVQTLAAGSFQRFAVSSLLTRVTNDVIQIQNTIFMSLRIMLRAPLLVAGSVIMAFFVQWQLALILFTTVPLLSIVLIIIVRRAAGMFSRVQQAVDQVNHTAEENLTAVRLVKTFVRRKHESKKFHSAAGQLQDRTVRTMRMVEITMPLILLVMNGSIMAVLWFGTAGVTGGAMSVGEVVAVINYVTRMTGALSIFSMIIIIFSRAKASAARISSVLEEESTELPRGSGRQNDIPGEVVFRDVTFTYPEMPEPVLSRVSFSVSPGSRTAVLGAAGSGKTTLIQMIPKLLLPDEGEVVIDGVPASEWKTESLRAAIGYVPQEAVLFSGTIADNLRWGREDASEEEMVQALKDAQIYGAVQELPDGLYTRVGQRGINLSGGQKQRISIARALIRDPSILLLDDSTSALDTHTEKKLLDVIESRQCTVLMITQKLASAETADQIVLLEDGMVEAAGTDDELARSSRLYRAVKESQEGGGMYA
ncbi:ABC transporter ATP-binding protein [Alkalicoccus urumqiensis]|uniref:ABC transporter ATP-binding protein n=1 Tax=Alkalicoccus urumqiensis TaxID=1548213 RepID=A0A2P6MIL7_ALKUR|nr:ABC transporter ATP-binding protein [Alkalicoccus urumqiensis]PRO66145.1 ABC transporter ATP-binding protein [Alkalicoccus urumqiensis]